MDKKYLCPKCNNSWETVRHGTNNTVSNGERQRRKCKKCARTFYEDEAKFEEN